MKWLNFYKDKLGLSKEDEVFAYLIDTLKPPARPWDYFVDWRKVFANVAEIETLLKKANDYLVGSNDFDESFKTMLTQEPSIAKIIPILIASRSGNITILGENYDFNGDSYDFNKQNITDNDIEKYLTFVKETGLASPIEKGKIKNLVDYVIGVETGLNSNAHKNKSGKVMENIVEKTIREFCAIHNFEYKTQVRKKDLLVWNYQIPLVEQGKKKSEKRYDFAINTKKELWLIEANFYSGTGSKLDVTAGAYKGLFDKMRNYCRFIWVTDGKGWESSSHKSNLRETFDDTDHVFNLTMLEQGVLEALL